MKARVVREQIERQCKRIRELRPERDNLIRETIEEVRVRVSAEQRLRTEERVRHWNKVDNWLAGDIGRVWVVRISEKQLLGYRFGEVNWDKYIFLSSPAHNQWGNWDVEEEEGSRAEGPH